MTVREDHEGLHVVANISKDTPLCNAITEWNVLTIDFNGLVDFLDD